MKVFSTTDLSLKDRLEGKVAVVMRNGDYYDVFEGNSKIMSVRRDIDIVEILADLGYDFVIFTDESMPKVSSLEDIAKLEDYESLKSLIRKVKVFEGSERCGAIGIFIGFVRRISDGKEVVRLEYERFDELYWIKLREIEDKIRSYSGVVDVKIHHKVGVLKPYEDILYIVVMGENRKVIWKPLEDCLELVKKELPIWKKEVFEDGAIWVHDKLRDRLQPPRS